MTRPKWKGPIINIETAKLKKIKLVKRDTEIVSKYVGLTFSIHNGKKYIKITVSEEMLGYKFGAFAPTRGQFFFKKKKLKK